MLGPEINRDHLKTYQDAKKIFKQDKREQALAQFKTLLTLIKEKRNPSLEFIRKIEDWIERIENPEAYKHAKYISKNADKLWVAASNLTKKGDFLFKDEQYDKAAEIYTYLIQTYNVLDDLGFQIESKDRGDSYWNKALSLDLLAESMLFPSNKQILIKEVLELCKQALVFYRGHVDKKACRDLIAGCDAFLAAQRSPYPKILNLSKKSDLEISEHEKIMSLLKQDEQPVLFSEKNEVSEDFDDSEIVLKPAQISPAFNLNKESSSSSSVEPEISNGKRKRKSEIESLAFFGWDDGRKRKKPD